LHFEDLGSLEPVLARADTAHHAARLEIQASKCFAEWLTSIE